MYEGRVVRGPYGGTSKSARDAVFLDTGRERFLLRRQGGNPFADPELDRLVGKRIRGEGTVVAGSTLVLSRWDEVATGGPDDDA